MFRISIALVSLTIMAACGPSPLAEMPERLETNYAASLPPMASFATVAQPRPTRPNTQIARDFLDLSFEMESGRPIPVLSRFEGPITVAVLPGAPATLSRDLDQLIARLRSEAGLNISRIPHGQTRASITIETLPRARMQRAVPHAACFVVPRASSWDEFRAARRNGNQLDWTTLQTREHVAVFIPSDVSPQEVRDCLHEEVAQALGPLNDLYRLPDSIFNDDNFHAVLTGFDMLVLRAYYDGALQSGMSRQAVAARLPDILNRLNPGGAGGPASATLPPNRQWINAIETALGGNSSGTARIAAAEQAVAIATQHGWRDVRLGFSYFALGRLTLPRSAERSVAAFVAAGTTFRNIDPNSVQVAQVDMQLAAFALSAGEANQALTLVNRALPAATTSQNATLLSTLLMIKAEALELQGRASEAATVRLDSLAWARYGFGREEDVRERLTEVAALSPQNRS